MGKPASSSDGDFVEGANDSDADEEPSFSDVELLDQVEQAARGFVTASLTRGYPEKGDSAYLKRTERLMTPKAAAGPRLGEGEGQVSKRLYSQRERTRAEVSSINPTVMQADQAKATVEYRVVTERKRGSTWNTVKAGEPQQQTLTLVDKRGEGWLVNSVS